MAENVQTSKIIEEDDRSLEQKLATMTEELARARADLANHAYEAGVAEMAIGVLHNIGNAITPAKVSSSILLRNLQESPIRNHLAKALEPLPAALQESSLPESEKQRLISLAKVLPESIKEEYDRTIAEIIKIRDKQDHVESIISLQMKYSHMIGSVRQVSLNHLTEDAIKMMDESLRKREVEIETHFASIPDIRVEEPKLLQILVNLIKNGYESMDHLAPSERRLTFSTFVSTEHSGYVGLTIKDSGLGFDDADKDKLFDYGYTTKDRGSGFGLHSCLSFLDSHQGKIEACSKGKDQGAEFTIYLPH